MIHFNSSFSGTEQREAFPGVDWSGGKTVAFNSIVETAIELFSGPDASPADQEQWRGRTGGYFCHATEAGMARVIHSIGRVSEGKVERYIRLCQEKAQRLAKHVGVGHSLSWQSRNLKAEEYGGSVLLADNSILSFSGLTELGDEACCLVAGVAFGALAYANALAMARISGNPCFEPLIAFLTRGRLVSSSSPEC